MSAAKLRRLRPMLGQRFGEDAGALVDELGSAALALPRNVSRRNVRDRDPTRGKTQGMLRDIYTALRIVPSGSRQDERGGNRRGRAGPARAG